jgi:ABC-type transport system substrate-binding protein
MKVISTLLFASAVGLLGVGACKQGSGPRGKPSDSTTPVRGGTLRVATYSDIRSIDPAVSADTESTPIINLLFSGLVDYDDDGNIVPDLAERYERSDDGLTYRFFLRHGIQMHDGSELTAEDVKRSIERTLAPETPCPFLAFFERIDGLAEFRARKTPSISGVVIEGPYLVTIKLTRPDATFLSVLALQSLRPVCKSGGTKYEDTFQTHPCGAGPFRFEAWQQGRFLKLRRFEGYHEKERPYLDAIEMRMDTSRLTQRFLLERGEIDAILNEFERPGAIWFRTHPEWSKYFRQTPVPEVYWDTMNVEMRPFDDKRIRQAVAAALNRPNLQKYYEGWTVVTGHLIPPGIPGYEPHPAYEQKYDLVKARALMAEAGYPYDPATGKGGWPETITYYSGEGEAAIRYAQLMQHDLSQIGMRIEIKETSFGQYLALSGRPKTVAFAYGGWQLDFADPSDFFEPVLSSAAIAEEDSQNKSFFRNKAFDDLLDRAHTELDQSKRLDMYREAERIVCDEAPYTFTYNPLRLELLQPWVRGYKPHPVLHRRFKTVWIDQAAKTFAFGLLGPTRNGAALGNLFRDPHAMHGVR